MQAFLGAMNGELPAVGEEASNYAEQVQGSDLKQLMGGEGLELVFKQVGETLGNSIREITLEIEWGKKDVDLESIKFVQYVTTDGRLQFPAGGRQRRAAGPHTRRRQSGHARRHPGTAPWRRQPGRRGREGGRRRKVRRPRTSRAGLTLMEIALAVAILAVIATLTWGSLARSFDAYDTVTEIDGRYHNVRVAMNRMSKELSMAFLTSDRRHGGMSLGQERMSQTIFKSESGSPFQMLHFTAFAHQAAPRRREGVGPVRESPTSARDRPGHQGPRST